MWNKFHFFSSAFPKYKIITRTDFFNENLQWFIAEKYLFSKFLFVLKVIVKQIYNFIQTIKI